MKSKNFKDEEILGITIEDGKKVVYLKQGVKRSYKYDYLKEEDISHLNHELLAYQRYLKLLNRIGTINKLDEDLFD